MLSPFKELQDTKSAERYLEITDKIRQDAPDKTEHYFKTNWWNQPDMWAAHTTYKTHSSDFTCDNNKPCRKLPQPKKTYIKSSDQTDILYKDVAGPWCKFGVDKRLIKSHLHCTVSVIHTMLDTWLIDWLIEDTLQAQSTPVKDEVKFLGLIFDKLNSNSHVRILKKKVPKGA